MKTTRAGLLLLALAGSAAAELPARLEIAYEVQRDGSAIAEITASLEHANGEYRLVERWRGRGIYKLLGRATRTSSGVVGKDGPRPSEFSEERSGRDTARAWFDWKSNVLTSSYKGKTRTEPMPPNAQDRISFMLALALAPAGTKALDVHLANGRGVSHHVYNFLRRERVKTPAGEFDTLVVGRASDDQRLEMWLATALGNLPVRMLVVVKDGSRYDQVATRIAR
jgi:hypothetical protein